MPNTALERRPGLGPWRSGEPPRPFDPFPDSALGTSVGDRFLEVARRYPDREALSSPSGRWAYQDLAQNALRVAGGIQSELGREGPEPVAVLATHDGPLVVAILGVVLSGHIVVVLDPVAPVPQSAEVLEECTPRLLLHDDEQSELASTLHAAAGARLRLAKIDQLRGDHEVPARTSADPVMLAFTSGTSGSPKGGIITHGVLLNLVRGATNALGIGPEDRMPMLFPTSLAVAAYPMFLPLLNGGALATLDVRSVGLEPVADFLENERITLAYMAPTVVRFLVDALAGRSFPDLRMIALGGELVDGEVVALSRHLFGADLVANGFGTTETGVITLYVLDPDESSDGAVPAGYPVDGVELLILDEQGNSVERGESGEIVVVTPHIFAGYWGHPELTAQVLADDPEDRPGWRSYRTGDIGRLDAHGALVVLGRVDTKVKVRGRFVVLGDVESMLHGHEKIADAAVVAQTDDGIVSLHATVVLADGEAPDPASLRADFLVDHEAYRVPTHWHVVDELPRLPNGKLDRRALVDAGSTGHATPATSAPDTHASELEQVRLGLRDLWELLLPISGFVGLDDNFFHLGGDSLLAAQMLVMTEETLDVTIPMSALIDARTIRQLANVVVSERSVASAPHLTTTCVQPGDESLRPRLWFVHDLPGSAYRVRHLAEHLGEDQPVWSFESPLLRGEPNLHTGLDSFAARYVTDLRTIQPEGPYWLGGYSFGGICAYEMARQLVADGEEVAFLGVVDVGPGYRGPSWREHHSPPWPWFGVPGRPDPSLPWYRRARHHLDLAKAHPAGAARHWMIRLGLNRVVDPVRFRADLRRRGRVRPSRRLWYAWDEHWKLATKAWDRTQTYPGAVDLFWADQTGSTDNSMGWGPLVGELRIHRFAGFHEHLLEEHGTAPLARELRRVIDLIHAQPGS